MSLLNILNEDLKQAMKKRDKRTLAVIRMVKGAIQLEQISMQKEITDEEVIDIILKQVKLRNEAIIEFKKANRVDLIEEAELEIAILNNYLPPQLTEEELIIIIDQVIKEHGFTKEDGIGPIMKVIIPMVKGRSDIKKVNSIIQSKLT